MTGFPTALKETVMFVPPLEIHLHSSLGFRGFFNGCVIILCLQSCELTGVAWSVGSVSRRGQKDNWLLCRVTTM